MLIIKMRREQIAAVFNEWARRYSEDPEVFGSLLDGNGNAIEDYGEICAYYFESIVNEMQSGNDS